MLMLLCCCTLPSCILTLQLPVSVYPPYLLAGCCYLATRGWPFVPLHTLLPPSTTLSKPPLTYLIICSLSYTSCFQFSFLSTTTSDLSARLPGTSLFQIQLPTPTILYISLITLPNPTRPDS
ncbi:hypothetical protein F5B18DRAFT_619584 [Nemania serpens]|nr:hypothetical protein F5B18DRAFT_619584 [Nemania serpens]